MLGGSEIVRGTLSRDTSLTGLMRAQPGDNLTDARLLLSLGEIRRATVVLTDPKFALVRVSLSSPTRIRGLCEIQHACTD